MWTCLSPLAFFIVSHLTISGWSIPLIQSKKILAKVRREKGNIQCSAEPARYASSLMHSIKAAQWHDESGHGSMVQVSHRYEQLPGSVARYRGTVRRSDAGHSDSLEWSSVLATASQMMSRCRYNAHAGMLRTRASYAMPDSGIIHSIHKNSTQRAPKVSFLIPSSFLTGI